MDPKVCQGPAGGPGITGSAVQVGTVTTLTGPIPGLFAGVVHGMVAFDAYLNSVGGICGRKLVDKFADDNLNASQNATATQSLEGSILSFVGSYSGVDQGGAPALQSSGIPDVGQALSPQRFDLRNNFSPQPIPASGYSTAPYTYLKQKYPDAVTHMAILIENQPTAQAESLSVEKGMQSVGFHFIYTDNNIEPTQTDFSADAQAMKANGVQGVVFLAVSSLYADLAKAIQNAGLNMPLADYSQNAYDPVFLTDAGSAANGAKLFSFYAMYDGEDAATTPVVALFDKWYRAINNGAEPDEFAADAWLSGMLFIAGLNRGGGLTRPDLLSGLQQITSFDGAGLEGPANPAAKQGPSCFLIIDVINQKFVRDPGMPQSGLDCPSG